MTPVEIRNRRTAADAGLTPEQAHAQLDALEAAERELLLAHAQLDGHGAPRGMLGGDLRDRIRSLVAASATRERVLIGRLTELRAQLTETQTRIARALAEVTT